MGGATGLANGEPQSWSAIVQNRYFNFGSNREAIRLITSLKQRSCK